jgi:hypothetical protein
LRIGSMGDWIVLFWLGLGFVGLVISGRWLSRHIQGLGLLLFESERGAIGLYCLALFPGVVLHELSHFAAAKLLRVPTGGLSVVPKHSGNGELLLGSVQVARTDPLRAAAIGASPLLAGCAAVLSIARWGFGLADPGPPLSGGWLDALAASLARPGFAAWLYLAFAVSNSMLPSSSDRRGWIVSATLIGGLLAGLYLLGWFPELYPQVGRWALGLARMLCYVLGISVAASAVVAAGVLILEKLAGWAKGLRIEY